MSERVLEVVDNEGHSHGETVILVKETYFVIFPKPVEFLMIAMLSYRRETSET